MSKDTFFDLPETSDGGFDIRIRLCIGVKLENWTYRDSIHRCWVFYWNADPGAFLEYDDQTIELSPEEVVLIPPYTRYSSRNDRTFRHFYIHFEAPPPFNRISRGILTFPAAGIRKFFRKFRTVVPGVRPLLLRELLYHYLGEIPAGQFLEPGRNILEPRIELAMDMMNEQLKQPRTNRELCRRSGLNLNDFYRKFREELGITPKQYQLSLRMDFAREQLLHSDAALEEIAEQTGFADRFQFSKAFRRFYSIPPAAYRKKYRSEP